MPPLTRADVSPERLAALNAGVEESRVLVEWLAVDHGALLTTVLRAQHQPPPPAAFLSAVGALTVPKRMARIAQHLADRRMPGLREVLELHPSDSVRIWAALMVGLDPDLSLQDRLGSLRVFAADPHAGVREYAWMAFRPHLAEHLEEGLRLLALLARNRQPYLRRFASEASRPRGVWCAHLRPLRQDPERARPLLDLLKSDEDRYVQMSVANWINDASKDRPDWALDLAARWERESPTPQTAWILKRGLRTLKKATAAG